MPVIGPFVYGLLVLTVAGLVHLSTVLALPWLAARDGFVRLGALVRDNEMSLVTHADARASLPFSDPATAMAGCRYVLDKGPVRVRAAVGPSVLSVIFLRKGAGIFQSVSDRAATQNVLDIVIATPEQMQKIISLDSDDEPVQEIRLTSADEVGLVLVRAVVPTESERGQIEALVAAATCEAESLDR